MPEIKDQTGRIVLVDNPRRIISLVPSQTELLYALGLDERVAGITKFCIHPDAWYRSKTRVGGTKQLDLEKIREVNPDLIIANREENDREQVEILAREFPVWVSDVHDTAEAYDMMISIGNLTGTEYAARTLVSSIREGFDGLPGTDAKERPSAAYLIWQNPFMAAGGDTFINAMMEIAGFRNVFARYNRYPELTTEQILEANCECLLLSSEPYPFREKHRDALAKIFPGKRILLVDGEIFSWYGSRMLEAPAYFRTMKIRGM